MHIKFNDAEDTSEMHVYFIPGHVYIAVRDEAGDVAVITFTPEDTAALGAHLIELAKVNGGMTPEVQMSYAEAMAQDTLTARRTPDTEPRLG